MSIFNLKRKDMKLLSLIRKHGDSILVDKKSIKSISFGKHADGYPWIFVKLKLNRSAATINNKFYREFYIPDWPHNRLEMLGLIQKEQ